MHGRENSSSRAEDGLEEDDFGLIIDGQGEDAAVMTALRKRSLATICLRYMTRLLLLCRSQRQPSTRQSAIKDRELLNILLSEADPCAFAALAQQVFDLVATSTLEFNDEAVLTFLEVIGEYLRSYMMAKSPMLHVLAMSFIRAVARIPTVTGKAKKEVGGLLDWYVCQVAEARQMSWQLRSTLVFEVLQEEERLPMLRKLAQASMLLLEDPDIRVRFATAASLPLRLARMDAASACQTYAGLSGHLDAVSEVESVASRVVFIANVIVTCPPVRRPAMFHIYQIASENCDMSPYLQASLDQVAIRLGPCHLSDLYMAYAPRILASQTSQGFDPMSILPGLYGYRKREDFASDLLARLGPLLYNLEPIDGQLFHLVCRAARADPKKAVSNHLPGIVAMHLVDAAGTVPSGTDQVHAHFERELTSVLSGASASKNPDEQQLYRLDFALALFLLVGDTPAGEDSRPISQDAEAALPANSLLESLEVIRDAHPPQGSWTAVRSVLGWVMNRWSSRVNIKHIVMHTMQSICSSMAASVVLSERRRLVRNLILLVHYFQAHVEQSSALLAACNRSALAVFAETDLALAVLPLLRWTLRKMGQGSIQGNALAFRHLAAAQTAVATCTEDELPRVLGFLRADLESLIPLQSPGKQRAFELASAIWPRQDVPAAGVPSQIAILGPDLSEIVEDQATDPAIVLLLATYDGHADLRPDASLSFKALHRVRSCLSTLTTDTDASAVLELLYRTPSPLRTTSLEIFPHTKADRASIPPRVHILNRLFASFDRADLQARADSYRTICAYIAPISEQGRKGEKFMSLMTLDYLKIMPHLPAPAQEASTASLTVLLKERSWGALHHHGDGLRWATAFASLVASAIGPSDADYQSLTRLFARDSTAAYDLLPYMVLQLLKTAPESKSTSGTLSKYLEAILRSESTATTVVRAILSTLEYLRGCRPEEVSQGYTNDQRDNALLGFAWLRIDPYVLCQAALRCQLYAAALLYLELVEDTDYAREATVVKSEKRRDVGDCARLQESILIRLLKQLLFTIYGHIGDPDGFYGIPPSSDFAESLAQRLHHEGQWDDAFSLHAAQYEANPQLRYLRDTTNSLVQTGYHQLARRLDDTSSTNLESAWRTDTWDLPLATTAARDQQGLYAALRAVHRGRDIVTVAAAVKLAITETAHRYGQAGEEDPANATALWRELLCLREVDRWNVFYERLRASDNWTDPAWRSFVEIPLDLE